MYMYALVDNLRGTQRNPPSHVVTVLTNGYR